jgi:predicted methyltransferase
MHVNVPFCTLLLSLSLLAACSKPAPPAATPEIAEAKSTAVAEPGLRERLANPTRPEADRLRDAGRKPADVLEFLGIEPGMQVIDVIAAGGYYTEVLAIAVGPNGHVVAQNTDAVLKFRDGANEKAISERLAENRLPNVTRLNKNFQDMSPEDGQFDAAITALNFHDIYNGSGAEAAVSVLRTIYDLLKPGGVFGIVDHVGAADADNNALHRIEKSKARETAQAAGFVVEGDSDLLANPQDDHTQGVFSEELRGNTDRFLLKLRKPAE